MIAVDALSKHFGDIGALDDISFQAATGEVVGILGLNGAGKSTLLRILAGDLTPSTGHVRVANMDLVRAPKALRAKVGYLPEDAPLYREMKVRELLRFSGKLHGIKRRHLARRIRETAKLTHIEDHLDRVIDELSMGYRKRVGIAQAILHDPDVVILDEPVSALDPAEIVGMRRLIRSLGGRHTVMVSSHILSEIHETCDRIMVLHGGKLVASGSEEELRQAFGSKRHMVLEARGDEETVLDHIPTRVLVERVEHVDPDEEISRYHLEMTEGDREVVLSGLVMAGVGILEYSDHSGDLETVFLSLVKEVPA